MKTTKTTDPQPSPRVDSPAPRTDRTARELSDHDLRTVTGGYIFRMKPVYISSYQSSGSAG